MFIFRYHRQWVQCPELPPLKYALPNGIVAFGGEYSAECFLKAYQRGIFPWPSGDPDDLIPWFCPPERFVLEPAGLHISHSLRQTLKRHKFSICADRAFRDVIHQCAIAKRQDDGTWITKGMEETFCALHELGVAHSVECYLDGELAGGFYGTCFGQIFGGESMFTKVSDATKVAFVTFVRRAQKFGIKLIDCQCYTDNMARYGAHDIPRDDYLEMLNRYQNQPLPDDFWSGPWECSP